MIQNRKLALLSVYNKDGIVEFAKGLIDVGFDIIASGGTAKKLIEAGLPVIDVADFVGGKAILGHRVVTLSRELYAALLATESPGDVAELEELGIRRIDLVCVDMYPLQEEINSSSSTTQSVIEKTDVGGPTMLHGGSKGQRIVVCDPIDRVPVLKWLQADMPDKELFINNLISKAESVVAEYILNSARYHSNGMSEGMVGERTRELRYGENPHQPNANLYQYLNEHKDRFAPNKFKIVGGSDPSFINITDLDRLIATAVRIAAGLERNGKTQKIALAVKHGNVCGVGVGELPLQALKQMVLSDPTSLSGGCVLVNFTIEKEAAEFLRTGGSDFQRILDTIIAPEFTKEAKDRLNRTNGKCRMFENKELLNIGEADIDTSTRFRPVRGGFLTQDPDVFVLELQDKWKSILTDTEQQDLIIAWAIGATANSNTVVLVHNGCLLGRGVAQPSRVLACKVALLHAKENGHEGEIPNSVAYSDSFFPFDDGPIVLANAGIKTIFATSGSIRDAEVLETCERLNVRLLQLPDKEARGFHGH